MKRLLSFLILLGLFIQQVLLSSVKVIFWIYQKPRSLESEFFSLKLRLKNPWQRIILSHFITLTPGTLTVDILDDSLLVHILSSSEKASTIALVQNKVEPLLKKIWGQA